MHHYQIEYIVGWIERETKDWSREAVQDQITAKFGGKQRISNGSEGKKDSKGSPRQPHTYAGDMAFYDPDGILYFVVIVFSLKIWLI